MANSLDPKHPILLYDGDCGLCARSVQWILKRDHDAVFRFAMLQSQFSKDILTRHGHDPERLDTVYVVSTSPEGQEQLRARSRAFLFVCAKLHWPWKGLSLFRIVPKFISDGVYRLVASNRIRLFGRADRCALPKPEWRDRFLEVE